MPFRNSEIEKLYRYIESGQIKPSELSDKGLDEINKYRSYLNTPDFARGNADAEQYYKTNIPSQTTSKPIKMNVDQQLQNEAMRRSKVANTLPSSVSSTKPASNDRKTTKQPVSSVKKEPSIPFVPNKESYYMLANKDFEKQLAKEQQAKQLVDDYVYFGDAPKQANAGNIKRPTTDEINAQARKIQARNYAREIENQRNALIQKTLAEKQNDESYAKDNPVLGNLAIFDKKVRQSATKSLSGDVPGGLVISDQYEKDRNQVMNLQKQGIISNEEMNKRLQKINDDLENDKINFTGKYIDWEKSKKPQLSPAEQAQIIQDTYGSNLAADIIGTGASIVGTGGTGFANDANLITKSLQGASGIVGKGANVVGNALSRTPKLVQAGANEVIPGAIYGGMTPLMRGEDPTKNPGEFVKESVIGAAFGAGLGAIGSAAGSAFSKLLEKLTKNQQQKITQLTLPPGEKLEALPSPSGEKIFAQTSENVQPVQPNKMANQTKTPKIIKSEGNVILESIAKELKKPIGLPEGKISAPTRARIYSKSKEIQQIYEDKWNRFVEYVNTKYAPKNRQPTQIEVVSEWSQFADRTDPNIFTVLELAFPEPKKSLSQQAKDVVSRFGSDIILKAKENQRMRDIVGLPPIVKSKNISQQEGTPLQFKKEVFAFRPNELPRSNTVLNKTNQIPIQMKNESVIQNEDSFINVPSAVQFVPNNKLDALPSINQARMILESKVKREFPDVDVSTLNQSDLEDLAYQIDKKTSGVKTYSYGKNINNDIENEMNLNTPEKTLNNKMYQENIQVKKPLIDQFNNQNTQKPTEKVSTKSELIMQEDLLRKIKRELNVTIKTGFVRNMGQGLKGFFNNLTHVIRTKKHNQFDTIAHEVGHNMDRRYGLRNDPNLDQKELIAFSRKYRPNHLDNYTKDKWIAESIAEYFRAFMLDPNYARDNAKNFTQLLDSKINKQDWKGLYSVAGDMQKYYRQSPFELAKSHVQMENPNDVIDWMTKLEKFYTGTVDQYYPTAKAEIQSSNGNFQQEGGNLSAYIRNKGLLPAEISPYKLMRLSEGLPDIIKLFLDQKMKPILKIAKKEKISLHDLATYAALRHSATETRGLESGFDSSSFSALNDPNIATPTMKKLHQMMLNANDELLKIAEESGLLSKETLDKWKKESPEYVPLRRYIEDRANGSQSYDSSKHGNFADMVRPSSFRERKGGTLTIMNPIQNMIENAAMIIEASIKNKVKLALADLSKFEGNAGLIENISDKSRALKLKNGEEIATLTANTANNEMMVMRNGKPEVYQLNPALFESLQGMTPSNSSFWMNVFQIAARLFSGSKTLTPNFWMKQLFVDEYHPLQVVHNIKYKPFWDMIRGVGHLVMDKKLVERFIKSGGSYGGYFERGPQDIQRVLDGYRSDISTFNKIRKYIRLTPEGLLDILSYVPNKMYDVFGYVPNKIDEARKISIFQKLTDKGYSDQEAAYIARDMMDFKRRGGSKDFKFTTDTTSFLNANIQGKDKNIRGLMQNPSKYLAKGILYTTIPTFGIYAWNKSLANEKQKQTINEAPAWKKYGFYQIAIPGTDVVGILPKPFDVSWFFSNILEDVLRYADQNNPSSVSEYMKENLKGSIPQLGNAIQPIIDSMYNENSFTGAPIVSRGLENIEPRSQYDAYSTKTSKKIGELFNISPKKFDFLTDSYLGDFSKLPKRIIDDTLLNDAYPNEPQSPKDSYAKQFLYGRFFSNQNQQSDIVNKFYEEFDKYQRLGLEAKKKGQNGDKEAYQKFRVLFNIKKRVMDKSQQDKNRILNNINLSDEEKRKLIDQINQRRKQAAEKVLNQINNLEGSQ